MNNFELNLRHITNDESVIIDEIKFSNAAFVRLLIDGKATYKFKFLERALIVFSELVKSLACNGCYLIFTSASGIADDGGWEGVNVIYNNGTVSWEFIIEDKKYYFEFQENKYRNEINNLKKKVNALPVGIELEPTEFFPPESWG